MPHILPLPCRRVDGRCPWCNAVIMQAVYSAMPPTEILEMEDGGNCPKCQKPIRAVVDEVITYETKIVAERTPVDKRYLAHMGIAE